MSAQLPRIFVVDDDEDLRVFMQDFLSIYGYEVRTRNGARGAHALICQVLPALVIVDLWLEHPTAGLDVVREVRADPVTAAIPLILYSAALHTLDGQREGLLSAGVGLLQKPFKPDELIEMVEAMLG